MVILHKGLWTVFSDHVFFTQLCHLKDTRVKVHKLVPCSLRNTSVLTQCDYSYGVKAGVNEVILWSC